MSELKNKLQEVVGNAVEAKLDKTPSSHRKPPSKRKRIDWSQFDKDSSIPYTDYWDESLSYTENLEALYNRVALLPHKQVLTKLCVTYAIAHSLTCRFLPVLNLFGTSGTGKSQISHAIAATREQTENILGSASTFASIRNQLNNLRWDDLDLELPEKYDKQNENPYLLVLADIKEFVFQDDKLFALFRNGVSRDEDKLLIAGQDGTNLEFRVFGGKVVSTTDGFFMSRKYEELYRRMLIIPTKHINFFTQDEKDWFDTNSLSPYELDYKGLNDRFEQHWSEHRIAEMAKQRRQHGNWKKACLALGMTEHQFKACFDLMCTCYVSGITASPRATHELFCDYWEIIGMLVDSPKNDLAAILSSIIGDGLNQYKTKMTELKATGYDVSLLSPYQVPTGTISDSIDNLRKQGAYLPPNSLIADAMGDLGFSLVRDSSNKAYWQYNGSV